ncbi:MAG TPA: Gfo/Idh/MocA family oxidoreductase [Propionibacteriaceae bacterium]|nr:Gfo/Idh/MocA family oxidoreductase [Propionibacteriaceae bacterium]
MTNNTIGVGIIGAGGWAKYGHIPALRTLDQFTIAAISSRRQETADQLAAELGVPLAFGDYHDLIAHPDVDLVVIPTPGPEHAPLVRAAILGGKDVYSEWPLTTTTAESEELLQLVQHKGVRHVVGLQRRFAPSASYAHDLVRDGYVGTIRGVRMSVGVDAFVPAMPERYRWTIAEANFTNLLAIYGGHFFDLLFHLVGRPATFTGITQNQFPFTTITETGEQVPNTSAHEVMVIGALQQDGLFAIQLEGAQAHKTGLQIEITGTEGVLRITNPRGFQNKDDNALEGMRDGATTFSPLPIPDSYAFLGNPAGIDVSSLDTAYLYAAYARDRANGTHEASNFHDALTLHHMIDQISQSSTAFFS